jgi:hypothetical protein
MSTRWIERGRGGAGHVQAAHVDELEGTAVVGDIDRAVRADGRAVGPAGNLRHRLGAAVGMHPGQDLALDLGEDHRAVGHGDRAFRKPQALGDEFQLHASLPGMTPLAGVLRE